MDLNLKGKNAIISGGNKGLGAASAIDLPPLTGPF